MPELTASDGGCLLCYPLVHSSLIHSPPTPAQVTLLRDPMPRPIRSRASSISAASMDSNSSSLFSHASTSTSATKSTLDRQYPPARSAVRAQSIRLPTKLPPPPSGLADVDLSTLILDADLKDVPIGYYLGKLKELGDFVLCLHE